MVLDADAPAQLGKEIIDLLDNDQLRATLSKNIAKMALRNADEKIVELIYKHL
jgi:UDP-N-acetylglucosamine:LPS N-acetylglucosamine transferase